jgi:hypothetical protein
MYNWNKRSLTTKGRKRLPKDVIGICDLLSSGKLRSVNSLPIFRDQSSVPSSEVKIKEENQFDVTAQNRA